MSRNDGSRSPKKSRMSEAHARYGCNSGRACRRPGHSVRPERAGAQPIGQRGPRRVATRVAPVAGCRSVRPEMARAKRPATGATRVAPIAGCRNVWPETAGAAKRPATGATRVAPIAGCRNVWPETAGAAKGPATGATRVAPVAGCRNTWPETAGAQPTGQRGPQRVRLELPPSPAAGTRGQRRLGLSQQGKEARNGCDSSCPRRRLPEHVARDGWGSANRAKGPVAPVAGCRNTWPETAGAQPTGQRGPQRVRLELRPLAAAERVARDGRGPASEAAGATRVAPVTGRQERVATDG